MPSDSESTPSADPLKIARTSKDAIVLKQLAEQLSTGDVLDDGIISEALIENLSLPFAAAHQLAEHWRGVNDFGYQICCRPDASPEALRGWSNHYDNLVIEQIARHANTEINLLETLATSQDRGVICALLRGGRLNSTLVDSFACHPDQSVRAAVANETKSTSILQSLTADEQPVVRAEALANPSTDPQLVNHAALHEKNLLVLARITPRLIDKALIDHVADCLLGHFDQTLSQAILQNPHASDAAKVAAVLAQSQS